MACEIHAAVRFRRFAAGCTGGVGSDAATIEEVVAEIAATNVTERGKTRADDRVTEAATEDRKLEVSRRAGAVDQAVLASA